MFQNGLNREVGQDDIVSVITGQGKAFKDKDGKEIITGRNVENDVVYFLQQSAGNISGPIKIFFNNIPTTGFPKLLSETITSKEYSVTVIVADSAVYERPEANHNLSEIKKMFKKDMVEFRTFTDDYKHVDELKKLLNIQHD